MTTGIGEKGGVKEMSYIERFNASNLTYVDVAYELGCCELTARNKINGKTKVTKSEAATLDKLFSIKGDDEACSISRHSR